MTHNYQILSFDPTNATMVIEFEGLQPLNFHAPNDGTQYLTGQELEDAIQSLYPTYEVERISAISNLTGAEDIVSKVVPKYTSNALDSDNLMARNMALAMSDWTQIPGAPLTTEKINEWATYRQELRDLPTQAGWPLSVDWPIVPTK
jgi:hypothetical protein